MEDYQLFVAWHGVAVAMDEIVLRPRVETSELGHQEYKTIWLGLAQFERK